MKILAALLAGGLLLWLVFNLIGAVIVGFIARSILPVKDKIGWGTTIVVGFLGGIVGRLVFRLLHWPTHFGMGFVASIVGAFVLLLVHHLWVANKAPKTT